MVLPFLCPACLHFCDCGSGRGEEPGGVKGLRLIRIRLTTSSLAKTPPTCQTNSLQARIADSSSRNAVNFSSARKTNNERNRRRAMHALTFRRVEKQQVKGKGKEERKPTPKPLPFFEREKEPRNQKENCQPLSERLECFPFFTNGDSAALAHPSSSGPPISDVR